MEFKLDWRQTRYEGDFEPYDQRLNTMLSNLPVQLPNLKDLSIAFQEYLWPDPDARSAPLHEDFGPWLEDKVLLPLDRVVKNMEQLQTVKIYFTSSVHSILRKYKDWERMRNGDFRASFWRGSEGSAEAKKGIWICEGRDDSPIVCTMMPPVRQMDGQNE